RRILRGDARRARPHQPAQPAARSLRRARGPPRRRKRRRRRMRHGEAAGLTARALIADRGRVRAVIADDEPHLAEHLRTRLAELWPELEVLALAANGLEALRRIDDERPEIAFLDIRMPGLTGLELARRIDARIHVVFVTAFDQYAVEAFDREAVDYLLKPVTDERLVRAVERLRRKLPAP